MRILYTGLTPPSEEVVHCPLIQIVPRPSSDPMILQMWEYLPHTTHIIVTSKSTVHILFSLLPKGADLSHIHALAVGKVTASHLKSRGFRSIEVPSEETGEGLVQLIDSKTLKNPFFLWPHSARSRPIISRYLQSRDLPFYDCILYDTITRIPDPLPDLSQFDEIIFTSPSTVEAFLKAYGTLPNDLCLTPIGPITAKFLNSKLQ